MFFVTCCCINCKKIENIFVYTNSKVFIIMSNKTETNNCYEMDDKSINKLEEGLYEEDSWLSEYARYSQIDPPEPDSICHICKGGIWEYLFDIWKQYVNECKCTDSDLMCNNCGLDVCNVVVPNKRICKCPAYAIDVVSKNKPKSE